MFKCPSCMKLSIVGLRAQVWPAQQVKCPYVYMSDRTETAAITVVYSYESHSENSQFQGSPNDKK